MKKTELIQVLTFINDSYSGKMKYPSGNDEKDTSLETTWLTWLKDYKYETIMMVLKDLLPQCPEWPPTPMQVINRIKEIAKPPEGRMTPAEAWDEAVKIAVGSSYHKSDTEIMADTPDLIRRAIRSTGGLEQIRLDDMDNPFLRNRFIDAYKTTGTRLEHEPLPELSSSIQKEIKQLGDGMRMIGKEK